MANKHNLRGTMTALVTPMTPTGAIDYAALARLLDEQLAAGISALVVNGTTAEAATLSAQEREASLRFVVQHCAGHTTIMAGTGASCTADAVAAQQSAHTAGADCGLCVTPAYNRPNPEGLLQHYTAVAQASPMPVMLYNVPSRTGLDMRPDLVIRLAQIPNVVGIKEATGDLMRISALRMALGDDFAILSGDDNSCCAATLMGADGVISVASNFAPQPMVAMIAAALQADVRQARALHEKLLPVLQALGVETNPLPVKAALAWRGIGAEAYRLPMCRMARSSREHLCDVLVAQGLLQHGQAKLDV